MHATSRREEVTTIEMSDLAGRRAHLWSDVRRPAPARLERHSPDGGFVEVDHVHPAATEIARPLRSVEMLSLEAWHAGIVPPRLASLLTYHVFGSGTVPFRLRTRLDLEHRKCMWDQPQFASSLDKLEAFARVIRFDRRETECSCRERPCYALTKREYPLPPGVGSVRRGP